MPIGTGLNALLSSGQNLQQPDLVGKYFAGSQIAQNNQNQAFQNNLLSQRADMQQKQFDRLEANDLKEQEQLDAQNQAFQDIMSNAVNVGDSPDPHHQKVMETLQLQWASGDRQGAINNYVASVQTLGKVKTIGSPLTDDQGNVTVLVEDPSSPHGMSAVSMGMYGKTKADPNQMWGETLPGGGSRFGSGQPPAWNPQATQQPAAQQPPLQNNALGTNSNVQTLLNSAPINPATVVSEPKVDSGNALVLGPNGLGSQPLPGSQAERDARDAQFETEAVEKAAVAKARSITDISRASMAVIDDLMDNLTDSALGKRGVVGEWLNFTGDSDKEALESRMSPIKSQIALQAMELARQGSSTGATGFGALSEKELDLLQSTLAELNPRFPDQFVQGLAKVRYHFQRLETIANDVDPGVWDSSVYMNAPTWDEYRQVAEDKAAAQAAAQAASPNQLKPSTTPSIPITKPSGQNSGMPTITTQQEFDALPKGTIYLENGNQFVK